MLAGDEDQQGDKGTVSPNCLLSWGRSFLPSPMLGRGYFSDAVLRDLTRLFAIPSLLLQLKSQLALTLQWVQPHTYVLDK